MKEKIIYVASGDEITQVAAKLQAESQTATKIFLVVPSGAHLFSGIHNFKLIKKISQESGFEVVLVSSDRFGRHLAETSGIVALSKLELKRRKSASSAKQVMVSVVRRPVRGGAVLDKSTADSRKFEMTEILSKNKVPFAKSEEENLAQNDEQFESVPEKRAQNQFDLPFFNLAKTWRMGRVGKILLSFTGLSVVVILFVLVLVLPKAEIVITMRTTSLPYQTSLTVNANLQEKDFSANVIPGKKYEKSLEKSYKFKSTGKHAVGEKAKGTMKLINKTWYTQPLVANTQLRSADGHIFRLNEGVVLPPRSETLVQVTADQPGSAYNVPPGKFVIVKLWEGVHDLIYGETTAAMTGGTDVDQMYVTQEDLNGAFEKSKSQLVSLALQQIRENLPADKVVLDQAISVDSYEPVSDAKVEALVSEFTVKAKIKVTAIAYVKKDYEELTVNQIKTLLTKDQKIVNPNLDVAKHKVTDFVSSAGTMRITTIGEAQLGRILLEDALKAKLVGKTTGDAESFLTSQPAVERVTINYWPFWVKRIPIQDGRIFLKAEYIKD